MKGLSQNKMIYVLLPCYNEEENIEELIEKWLGQEKELNQKGYSLHISPIDDKSTDRTKEIISSISSNKVHPLYHKVNQNLGGVLKTGILDFLSISSSEDLLVVMDGDNTHDPKYVQSMLDKINKYDLVICSRYQEGSGIEGLAKHREWMSVFARLYYTIILSIPNVKDYTCGYRMYTKQALDRCYKEYGDKIVEQKSFACMMEILYKLHKTGAKVSEVPFVLRYDFKGGESKMNVVKTIKNLQLKS